MLWHQHPRTPTDFRIFWIGEPIFGKKQPEVFGPLDGIPINRLVHEGTLYGNGVYLAEAVSKSDEYTTPHSGGLRSILICLSSLGRVTWLKMSSYRMGPKIYENNSAGNWNHIWEMQPVWVLVRFVKLYELGYKLVIVMSLQSRTVKTLKKKLIILEWFSLIHLTFCPFISGNWWA